MRPSRHTHPEYVTMLRLTDYNALRIWEMSDERAEWPKKADELLLAESWIAKPSGMQAGCDRPDLKATCRARRITSW